MPEFLNKFNNKNNKFNNKLIKIIFYLFTFLLTLILSIFLINIYVLSFYSYNNSNINNTEINKNIIYKDISALKYNKIGLVFGARVYSNGNISDILKDRLDGARIAYKNKRISKIIVSGDNSESHYNEPEAMRDYLISVGINESDIYLDYAGFDTYSSIYRAGYIFGAENLTLFTQDYHLKRAIYISDRLNIGSIGFSTDFRQYRFIDNYNTREILSRVKAFVESEFKFKPKFLGEKIIIN